MAKNQDLRPLNRIWKTLLVFLLAAGSSIGVSLLGVGKESIIMVFLLGVLFTTVLTSSYIFGVIASIASVMLFNFLFTEPRFTLVIYSSNDIMLLAFFLVTAIVSGIVTSRLRQQMKLAAKNEMTARILYSISSGFLSISGQQKIIHQAASYILEHVGCRCEIQLSETGASEAESDLNPSASIDRSYEIRSSSGLLGHLLIPHQEVSADDQGDLIVQSVVTQLGIALDREQLRSEQERIRLAMERERLQATLLRSIAHDLRSPLTALSGAGNLLADHYEDLPDDKRRKLATDISEEIAWLISLVENILNMTRLSESQELLHKSDEVVDDVVSEALTHVDRLMKGRTLTVVLPDDVMTVPMDGKLIVKVLINLLENAIRHTPQQSEIHLAVDHDDKNLVIAVADTGSGIDGAVRDHLFDRFVTADKGIGDSRQGIGLGLAICKTIVEAHGGTIKAEDNMPQGARFVFTLPLGAINGK